MSLVSTYHGKHVLITGGLGFIGSSLAVKLVRLGAEVTLVDNLMPEHGANFFNVRSIKSRVTISLSDVRDENIMAYLVEDKDFVFHMAGQVSHVLSLSNPYPDLDINIRGTATVLEALRKYNPKGVFIYGGTRGQYGKASNPAKESDISQPTGIHEISHLAAEQIVSTYHRIHGIPAILTRMTNVYGPRAQMKHDKYCVVNWFIRKALTNDTIPLFSKGKIIRDFLYIDDCVNALLSLALTKTAYGEIFNIASGKPTSFLALTKTIVTKAKSGRFVFAPFTYERKAQEPGDFWADISKIRQYCSWQPKTTLSTGIKRTIKYYEKYHSHYF